jgi:hypothetical protein
MILRLHSGLVILSSNRLKMSEVQIPIPKLCSGCLIPWFRQLRHSLQIGGCMVHRPYIANKLEKSLLFHVMGIRLLSICRIGS